MERINSGYKNLQAIRTNLKVAINSSNVSYYECLVYKLNDPILCHW